jgi:hypothetical protein
MNVQRNQMLPTARCTLRYFPSTTLIRLYEFLKNSRLPQGQIVDAKINIQALLRNA